MSDFRRTIEQPCFSEEVVMMGYEDNGALAKWGPCKRTRYILHYVTKGRGYFNGLPVAEGYGFYITPDAISEYHPDEEHPWNYFWIILSEELAKRFAVPQIQPDADGIFYYGFTEWILQERKRFFTGSATMKCAESLAYFFSLLSCHEKNNIPIQSRAQMHVHNAKLYIEEHFSHRLSIRDVAESIHVDDRYLYNLFVRYEGMTPTQYLCSCRIRTAKRLLRETALTVTEIADSVGFDDVCTFSKFFSSHVKVSPSYYRKTSQAEGEGSEIFATQT